MRTTIGSIGIAVLAGCAGANAGRMQSPAVQNVAVSSTAGSGSTTTYSYTVDPVYLRDAAPQDIAAPRDRLWQALPDIYKRMGLKLVEFDTATHIIGGERIRSHGNLGDVSLQSALDCGDQEGVPNVNRFDVQVSVRSEVLPAGPANSTVRTLVVASARPDPGSNWSPCTATQAVPNAIADALRQAVKQPQ